MIDLKKMIYLIAFVICSWFFFSCDEINPPYTKTNTIDTTAKDNDTIRRILLEDYTGFKCVHCPTAADLAKKLDTIYSGRLVLMAVHAGFFADTDKVHTYNFKTPEGTELDKFFGNSDQGNPNGLISRFGYPNSTVLKSGKWESTIQSLLSTKPKMSLKLTASYNQITRTISAKADIKYLQPGKTNDNLCVYILEDSIVKYQADVRYTPPDRWDYVHQHVLRGSFTGTWGEQLSKKDIATGTTFTKQYQYQIPAGKDWRTNKLKVIAFIHDFQNTYEVWQVNSAEVVQE